MEIINLILHVIAICSILALTHAIREMHDTIKMMMFESDIPEDLLRYIRGREN